MNARNPFVFPLPRVRAVRPLLTACLVLAALAPAGARAADPDLESLVLSAAAATPPRLLSLVPVQYPAAVRQRGVSGPVIVAARIGRDGRVREVRIEHSIPGLDEAALARVRHYEFAPAHLDGIEVEAWVEVPVVFDQSLPIGSRSAEPYTPEPYSDAQRLFESDVAVLHDAGAQLPSAQDEALRERIMQESLALDVLPRPGLEAVTAFLQGDTLGRSMDPTLHARRMDRWVEAARLAPWWPLPYRRIAAASIADRDFATAEVCARVILAGRPDDEGAIAYQRRARQLQLGEGRGRRKSGGGGKKH